MNMDEIIKTIREVTKEAGSEGAFFAIGCLAILGLAVVAKKPSSES